MAKLGLLNTLAILGSSRHRRLKSLVQGLSKRLQVTEAHENARFWIF